MRRRVLLPLLAALLLWAAGPAAAQSIGDLEQELRADQVYVEEGAEGDESVLRSVVADAADDGRQLYIVSIRGSNTDAESLAQSLKDRLGGTVLVVTPASIGAASSELDQAEIDRALDQFSGTVEEGSAAFAGALPGTSNDVVESSGTGDSGGGSGWGVLVFFVVVIGGIVLLVTWLRRRNRRRVRDEMGVRRATVAEELSEIGRDILALEDRVGLGDNADATSHFRQGNEQYLELQEQLDEATSLWQVTQVDYAADTAAWHLDAAEALLDGDEIPEQPQRPDLEVSRPPAVEPPPEPPAEEHPSPRVEPRQRRRTQWDPPRTRGGGFGDVLTGILVGDVLRGGGRSGRRAPGRWSGGGSLGGVFGGGGGGGSFGGSSGSRSRGSSGSRRR